MKLRIDYPLYTLFSTEFLESPAQMNKTLLITLPINLVLRRIVLLAMSLCLSRKLLIPSLVLETDH